MCCSKFYGATRTEKTRRGLVTSWWSIKLYKGSTCATISTLKGLHSGRWVTPLPTANELLFSKRKSFRQTSKEHGLENFSSMWVCPISSLQRVISMVKVYSQPATAFCLISRKSRWPWKKMLIRKRGHTMRASLCISDVCAGLGWLVCLSLGKSLSRCGEVVYNGLGTSPWGLEPFNASLKMAW